MPIFNVEEGSVRSRVKRKFYNKLLDWRKRANKKPLFVCCVRQIGKPEVSNRLVECAG